MEIKGHLKGVNIDYQRQEFTITLDSRHDVQQFEPYFGKDITLKITKYSERRSLDANAYLWVLCTKLAEVLKTSKDEVYEEFIQRYGYTDDEPIVLTVKSEVNMDAIEGHWKMYRESADGRFKAYMRLRGTSEYNKKEMAHFLDMVIEDCKEQGVETLTPTELMRLKEAWEPTNGGRK